MPSLPQSNNLQEIQRAFLERDAELRRLVGDTKTATAASVTGLRKTITSGRGTSGSTTPSGGTTATTVKGRRVITAVSTEAMSFYETNFTQAEFTESADIISIETNYPAWVRVYSSAAARLDDAARLFSEAPIAGTGLMMEVLTYEPDDLLIYLSPVPFWNNCDTVLGKTAYIAVTRWDSGDPEFLEMTFTILPQEEMDKNGSQGLPGPRGFTGAGYRTLGEWSGTETYLGNDVVSRNGSVYCSLLNDNLNQDPETATTCWTLWASKGGKGDKGDKGDNGTAATITVGTVTSGSSPSVTDSGTSSAAVLDFVLQKGDKGDPGESSINLKTNGTDNTVQTTLNLIAGANVTLTTDPSGGVTIAATGGGGGGSTWAVYDADLNPASPSSLDDEFNGSSLDAKWTTVNWSMMNSVTETLGKLKLVAAINGQNRMAALQALPTGDFTVVIKGTTTGAGYSHFGLILSDGTTAGSGSQLTFNWGISESAHVIAWSGFSGPTGGYILQASISAKYLRCSRNGTNYKWYASSDGETWTLLGTANPSFTPTHVGISVRAYDAITTDTFEYFRYYDTDTPTLGGMRTVLCA